MRSRQTMLAVLIGMISFGGCAGKSQQTPPQTVADTTGEPSPVTDLLQHHRHHHHGGVLMLITMSLDTLGLSPDEESKIEKLRLDLIDKMVPARADELRLVALLADGVEQSSIDPAKVDEVIAQMATASAAAHESAITDLNQLHAILTPGQRAALVDKLQAQWQLWRRANTGEQRPTVAIGRDIGLTADQVTQAQNELASRNPALPAEETEVQGYIRDFSQAFKSDTFDAASLKSASSANGHMAAWGAGRLAHFCEVVNPMLNNEQRQKLVELLREHLTHDEGQAKAKG